MAERGSTRLQEFESLSNILAKVPHKVQKGLFTQEFIEWTSIDVDSLFIAIGTNLGIVYLVDRTNGHLQKLQCKSRVVAVTSVKLCHNVDYLVSVGTSAGQLFIFQLPSILPGRKKQLHVYEVLDLHRTRITSLVWSQNSEKLYSGDVAGHVICTEFNYDNETSKSYNILTETHEIVQLDYTSRILLVSTKFRTVLYHTLERKQIQVGTKERKIHGSFGAVFVPGGVYYQPQDMVLFAVRPGLRLWKACSDGSVKTTFIFKDLLTKEKEGIELLDGSTKIKYNVKLEDMQFGPLIMYMDTYLVTFHEGCLFVIDPGLGNFYGYHTGLETIKEVAVCNDEIFILSSHQDRVLVRIAEKPLLGGVPDRSTANEEKQPTPMHTVSVTAEKVSQSIVGAFKGMGEKFQDAIMEGQILPAPSNAPPWGSASRSAPQPVEQPTSVVVVAKNNLMSDPQASTSQKGLTTETCSAASSISDFTDRRGADHVEDYGEQGRIGTNVSQSEVYSTKASLSESSNITQHEVSSSASEAAPPSDIAPGGPEWYKATDVVHPGAPPMSSKIGQENVPTTRSKQFREESLAFASSGNDSIAVRAKPKKKGKKKAKIPIEKDNISISSSDLKIATVAERSESPSLLPDTIDSVEITENPKVNVESSEFPFTENNSDTTENLIEVPQIVNKVSDIEKLKKLESELTAFPWEEKNNQNEDSSEYDVRNEHPSAVHSENNVTTSSDTLAASALSQNDIKEETKQDSSFKNLQPQVDDANKNTTKTLDSAEEPSRAAEESNIKPVADLSLHIPSEMPEQDLSLHLPASRDEDVDEEMFSIYDSVVSSSKSPEASCSSASQLLGDATIDDVLSYNTAKEKTLEGKPLSEKLPERTSQKRVGFMDSWTEILAPGNLQCICVTERIIWVVDKSDRVHWSYLSGSSLKWHKLEVPAQQISVSLSGSIVWRLYNGQLFAGTMITTRAPAGLKWVDFVKRDVVSMSVDEHMGWYVKCNGEVVMHKKLSRERPCFKPLTVPCDMKLVMVVCRGNVVWCLTVDRIILIRTGISRDKQEGTDWQYLEGSVLELLVSQYDLGEDGTAWLVDVVGRLWFTTGLTQDTPQGSGHWWQVPLTAYLMQDSVARESMKAIAEKTGELNRMRKHNEVGGLVAARSGNGIWLCPGYKNMLHLCCSDLEGHRWEPVYLAGMVASAMKWLHVFASGVADRKGLIWAQQPNGYIFCFPAGSTASVKVSEVLPPEPGSGQPFVCASVCESVVWSLSAAGKVWLRTGIRPSCPHGVSWTTLDMQQLGKAVLVWLSAGSQNVWAVDSQGQVYLRIGTEAPSDHGLSQAWVPVEGTTDSKDSKFEQIYVGSNDWMVWALDSHDKVYTRKGVTESMPIGTHWVSVQGEHLKQLCVGEQYVYGLNSQGEVLVRDGIKETNPKGTYWHKIPGCLSALSGSLSLQRE